MRNLILCLSLLLSGACALRGQTQLTTPVRVLPKADSSAAGELVLGNNVATVACTAANYTTCKPLIIQNNTLDASNLGSANNSIIFKGSSTAGQATFRFEAPSGNLAVFCDTSGGTGGAWELTRTKIIAYASGCSSTSNLDIHTDGTIRTSLGIGFYENGSLGGDAIAIRAPSGAVSSTYTINLPGTPPSLAGQALAWSSGSTYVWQSFLTDPTTTTGDMIYNSSGVITRLAVGSSGQCLTSNGSIPTWSSCGSDPAWSSYTPTVGCSSGSPTGTVTAGYLQQGKTVKVRIYWTGQCSSSSQSMTFTLPANPLTGASYQPLAEAYFDGSGVFSAASNVIVSGVNYLITSPIGANFPASTTFYLAFTGIYETN